MDISYRVSHRVLRRYHIHAYTYPVLKDIIKLNFFRYIMGSYKNILSTLVTYVNIYYFCKIRKQLFDRAHFFEHLDGSTFNCH